MRRTLTHDRDATFDQLLLDATTSLWRFEQQRSYHVDNETGLLTDFRHGTFTPPDEEPDLRAWFDQVRDWTQRAGIHVGRVRIVDEPPTDYQRWLRYVDRWNREAGEEIHYLPRWAITRGTAINGLLRQPFGDSDWWLIDQKVAAIMHRDAAGDLTEIEVSDDPSEIADAVQFARRAQRAATDLAEQLPSRAA